MSSSTWTPRAVASRATSRRLSLWRAVEAQHVASTIRLVDGLAEQELLEQMLETSKPPLSSAFNWLHYLLATPFRYPPPPGGSRFRSTEDPGVFYGADERRTACAELGYWRWRFLADSDGLERIGPAPQTLFRVAVRTRGIDLRQKPFVRDARLWTSPGDYRATQAFGRVAREAGIGLIRYRSVRDPEQGGCGVLLRPEAFAPPRRPLDEQTWFLTVTRSSSAWQRDGERFEFMWSSRRA